MNKTYLFLIFVLMNLMTYGQKKVSGIIVDKELKSKIAYVNIGIENKGVGTVSDENGVFELNIPENFENSILTFSHLGYEKYTINISEIQEGSTITLVPKVNELEEVIIKSTKTFEVGHKTSEKSSGGVFSSKGISNQVGTIIKNRKSIVLKDFNFYIYDCNYQFLKFRLNFYDVKSKKPNEFINKEEIIFEINSTDKGVFTVDLKDEDIVVEKDFICTLELLEVNGLINDKSNSIITLSLTRDKKGVSFKQLISLDRWNISNGYYLNFWFNAYEYE